MEDKLLTVKEVAEKLRRDPYTVRKLLREKKLKGYKPEGGTWLIRESAVNVYLEAQEPSTPEER